MCPSAPNWRKPWRSRNSGQRSFTFKVRRTVKIPFLKKNKKLSAKVMILFMCSLLTLSTLRKRSEPEAPVSAADKGASQTPAPEIPGFYQLPSSSSQAERLPTLQRVWCLQQGQHGESLVKNTSYSCHLKEGQSQPLVCLVISCAW